MNCRRVLSQLAALVFVCGAANANNLSITNVSLVNVTNGTADIQFDVSWDNSWRYEEMDGGGVITNHDAAWIFVKYRAGGDWKQAWLADTGHTAAAGTEISVANNGSGPNVGAFLRRNADGHGVLVATNSRVHWDYVAGGLTGTNGVDISVHGIEMVYIPEGPFYVGSGGTESYPFYEYPNSANAYLVSNENEVAIGTTNGNLYYTPHTYSGDGQGPVPAAFPKGYAAFYCMKHEISQGQYAQFLNRVPAGVDGMHFPNAFGVSRHTIKLTNGVYTATAPDRACNYLSWNDLSAFLDWAALRPMSELEFEKACRGPNAPVPNEYAWGDTVQVQTIGILGVDGSGTETASPANANVHTEITSGASPVYGPIRVGIFATSASTRHQAGAGYYGVMELCGNMADRTVTIGIPQGRAYEGTHGDGDSNTSNPDWPDPATASGAGRRGGDFTDVDFMHTSNRRYAPEVAPARSLNYGGRGVRTDW
ncbi:MAG: SUMF1/EgtB/PvdO family nonheme iron enzyme [Verrucomicrobia bacterium]|nr:SUMF1/EgtB/PvdO family nonheme iron enzyme [Verrucomicrobiota bacterium]